MIGGTPLLTSKATRGRKPILASSAICSKIEATIREVAEKSNYHVLGLDVDLNVVRALISLRPIDSFESVTKKVKGNVATTEAALALLNNTELWFHNRYSAAMKQEDLDTVFQPGHYAGTCGDATTAQIKSYYRPT